MICQRCGTMPATVNIMQKVNGTAHEYHLCAACAEELTQQHLQKAFGDMLGKTVTPAQKAIPQCPVCGLSQQAFVRNGLAGCPSCYQAFSGVLQPILRRSQGGSTQHTGKQPDHYQAARPTAPPPAEQSPIQALQQQLQQAIEQENYEQAAVLRDQLRAIQKEG